MPLLILFRSHRATNMENFADLLGLIESVLRKLFWFVSGQFIAYRCTWCRTLFLASEAIVIMALIYFLKFRGPSPGR